MCYLYLFMFVHIISTFQILVYTTLFKYPIQLIILTSTTMFMFWVSSFSPFSAILYSSQVLV